MAKQLVIVESPTKARLISKMLGKDVAVEASMGHVRDLPKSKISVDVEGDFSPTYVVPDGAKKTIRELKKIAKDAELVILAPDPDREGEAIAWHLKEALQLEKNNIQTQRIVFHEITLGAIEEAMSHPRDIDQNLVDAQQARRVLDRLVGYELSPFLWHKVRYGLSAGRVQSVAVRLVVEREREIQAFDPVEYWSIEGSFEDKDTKTPVSADLKLLKSQEIKKFTIGNKKAADEAITTSKEATPYTVTKLTSKEVKRNPSPPFTTSTLQQAASSRLGFSAKRTMMLAQKLYEGGNITYMRTDSVHLSKAATTQAQKVLKEKYGKNYALDAPRYFKTKSKNAQEAHEAIRPTNLNVLADALRTKDQGARKLYTLIWKRTLASQAAQSKIEQSAAIITGTGETAFRASGYRVLFDGYRAIYSTFAKGEETRELPQLSEGQALDLKEVVPTRHETEPPPRFNDASLVKTLEAHGIGRPSTYAPTLSTIQDRGYVEKVDNRYHPTDEGELVTDLLVEHFPQITGFDFTAGLEEKFDEITEGKHDWHEIVADFYKPFKKRLEEKEESVEKQVKITDTPCPHCKEMMLLKFGKTGKFLACPEEGSKVTLPTPEEAAQIKALEEKTDGEVCPTCSGPMKIRKGRFGFFLGCMDYPKCKGIAKILDKTGFMCPHCKKEDRDPQGFIVKKKGRGRSKPFYGCSRYPDCTFLTPVLPESEAELEGEMYEKWLKKPKKKAKKKTSKKKTSRKKASKKK